MCLSGCLSVWVCLICFVVVSRVRAKSLCRLLCSMRTIYSAIYNSQLAHRPQKTAKLFCAYYSHSYFSTSLTFSFMCPISFTSQGPKDKSAHTVPKLEVNQWAGKPAGENKTKPKMLLTKNKNCQTIKHKKVANLPKSRYSRA